MVGLRHVGRAEGRRRIAALFEQFDLAGAAGEPAVGVLDFSLSVTGGLREVFDGERERRCRGNPAAACAARLGARAGRVRMSQQASRTMRAVHVRVRRRRHG
jgi:hypothetical protein